MNGNSITITSAFILMAETYMCLVVGAYGLVQEQGRTSWAGEGVCGLERGVANENFT